MDASRRESPIRVHFYLSFPAGGIGKYTDQVLQHLAPCPDLEVQVVCLPEFRWRHSRHYRTRPILAGISHPWPPLRKAKFLRGQFVNPRRFAGFSTVERADIVHICNIHHLTFPLWERRLARTGARWMCTVHDVKRASAILNRRWETRQLQRFYRRCDALFVHSQAQAQELQEFAGVDPARIHQVPHGPTEYAPLPPPGSIAALRQRYGVADGAPLGLFFGFLRPDKNLEGLLEALALSGASSELLVAGNGESRAALEQARRLGIADRVHWQVRYIDDAEVPDLFAIADWVAVPYTERFTSQSGVLNLAAAYEKPVLATPSASFAELMRQIDLGVMCDGFTPKQIAAGIVAIEARLLQATRFQFSEYRSLCSWQENARLTRDVYHRVLNGEAQDA